MTVRMHKPFSLIVGMISAILDGSRNRAFAERNFAMGRPATTRTPVAATATGRRAGLQRRTEARATSDRGRFPCIDCLRGRQDCIHADRWRSRRRHRVCDLSARISNLADTCGLPVSDFNRPAPSDSGPQPHRRCVDRHTVDRLCQTHECDSRLSPWLPGSLGSDHPGYASRPQNPAPDCRLRAALRRFQANYPCRKRPKWRRTGSGGLQIENGGRCTPRMKESMRSYPHALIRRHPWQ